MVFFLSFFITKDLFSCEGTCPPPFSHTGREALFEGRFPKDPVEISMIFTLLDGLHILSWPTSFSPPVLAGFRFVFPRLNHPLLFLGSSGLFLKRTLPSPFLLRNSPLGRRNLFPSFCLTSEGPPSPPVPSDPIELRSSPFFFFFSGPRKRVPPPFPLSSVPREGSPLRRLSHALNVVYF